MNFSVFCTIFLGPSGSNWPELGGHLTWREDGRDNSFSIERAFCHGIFATYYSTHKKPGEKRVRRCCSVEGTLPKRLISAYRQPASYEILYADILSMMRRSTSPTRLATTHAELYRWVDECDLDEREKAFVKEKYTPFPQTREVMAEFAAAVLHVVLQREAAHTCASAA